MLYGNEIGVESWPVQFMNSIGLKKVLSKKSTASPRVILLEKIPRILSEKWIHMKPKHLIDETSRCKSTSRTIILKVQNNKLRSLTICDASPYRNVYSSPSVPLHVARVGIPLTCTSKHTETIIGVINTERDCVSCQSLGRRFTLFLHQRKRSALCRRVYLRPQ